jgi:hypothetical protein
MKKLSKQDIEELILLLEHRRKLRVFKEIITNKYFFIPVGIVFIYFIDNPNIVVLDLIKKMLSHFIL